MATYLKALVNFADVKAGDTFYAYKIPENPVEKYKHASGKLYYVNSLVGDDDIVILTEDMYEEVFMSFEEAASYPIKEVDVGVQDEEDFFSSLGLNSWEFDWSKIKKFEERTCLKFFDRWLCTDTYVGKGILEIDGKPVAFFNQSARKNDCNYLWWSKEAKDAAKKFAQEFIEQDETEYNDVISENQNMIKFFM